MLKELEKDGKGKLLLAESMESVLPKANCFGGWAKLPPSYLTEKDVPDTMERYTRVFYQMPEDEKKAKIIKLVADQLHPFKEDLFGLSQASSLQSEEAEGIQVDVTDTTIEPSQYSVGEYVESKKPSGATNETNSDEFSEDIEDGNVTVSDILTQGVRDMKLQNIEEGAGGDDACSTKKVQQVVHRRDRKTSKFSTVKPGELPVPLPAAASSTPKPGPSRRRGKGNKAVPLRRSVRLQQSDNPSDKETADKLSQKENSSQSRVSSQSKSQKEVLNSQAKDSHQKGSRKKKGCDSSKAKASNQLPDLGNSEKSDPKTLDKKECDTSKTKASTQLPDQGDSGKYGRKTSDYASQQQSDRVIDSTSETAASDTTATSSTTSSAFRLHWSLPSKPIGEEVIALTFLCNKGHSD